MQKYKGIVTVDSAVGKGSTFKLYFKISTAEKNVTTVPAKVKNTASLQKLKIIYVEDNNELREVFEESMISYGFQVTSFSSGAPALAHIQSTHVNDFDVVVSDVSMPQMNGVEFGIKIWNNFPETKIVFLTGYSDPTMFKKLAGLESNFTLVSKPAQIDVLANAINKLIGTNQKNKDNKKAS